MKINTNPARASVIIILFLLGQVLVHNINPAHAQSTTSTNMIVNPGFETSLSDGWVGDIYDDGTYGDTITTNNTLAHTGSYSARLDISNNDTSIALNKTTTNSHIELIQYPTNPPSFGNFTNRPDGLDMWFYVQPKYSGYTVFEVRFRTSNVFELDYVYYNPDPVLGYQGGFANSTNGSEGGRPVKVIFLPTLKLNQWNHLVRNVRQDWLAPLKLPNGTFVNPGFSLNDTLSRFEVNANFYKDLNTGNVYAETVWVDDILLYTGNTIPIPTLTFQDWTGITVDQAITWKYYNITTGQQAQLSPGNLVPSNTVTVRTYYTGYQIYTSPITPLTNTTIRLSMIAIDSSRSGFIAFNSTITAANVTQNDQNKIIFTSHGTGPSLIVVKVLGRPVSVDKDGASISTWTYNTTSGTTAIQSSTLGTFTILLSAPNDLTLTILLVTLILAIAVLGSAILFWRRRTSSRLSRETSKPATVSKNKTRPDRYGKRRK